MKDEKKWFVLLVDFVVLEFAVSEHKLLRSQSWKAEYCISQFSAFCPAMLFLLLVFLFLLYLAMPCRSRMNVPFTINGGDEALEKKFLDEAKKHKLFTLAGHRSVGGCRASLYNGMPLEGVAKLTDFMKSFMDENRKWLKMIERYLNIFEESVAHSPCWPNMAQRRVSSWALGPNFGSIWLQSLFWSLSGSCCPCRPGPGGFPRL